MLGLYIHVPFCVKKCKYCDFTSYKLDLSMKEMYISSLIKEMELYSDKENEITSIFLGGGTPSILSGKEIESVFKGIKNNFKINENAEITMECNPGTLTKEKLVSMKNAGVNRLSIGLQTTQEKHLNTIGRIHTYDEFEKNYIQALECGFDNINIDLMYCLPNQTFEDWKESLEKVMSLNPKHISAYSLILEEGTELYDLYNNGEFEYINEEDDMKIYNYTIEFLKDKGYNQYEISNYAKKGYECNHNILYWKCEKYIGLGPGASGYVKNKRYNNVETVKEYSEKLDKGQYPIDSFQELTTNDKVEEKVFMGLRMNEGIKFKDFEEFNVNFKEMYENQIKTLVERDLLEENNEGIKLTQKGREISNSVFIEFIN